MLGLRLDLPAVLFRTMPTTARLKRHVISYVQIACVISCAILARNMGDVIGGGV